MPAENMCIVFQNPKNDMFTTTTNLDEQCLRIRMFEAKQSHWQEGGNADEMKVQ